MLNQPLWIRCKKCEMKSFNTLDISHRYCGRCHKFHGGAMDYDTDYDLGPTPEELPKGFSWTDAKGQSWHCMQPMSAHRHEPCPSCVAIIDDITEERPKS